MTKTETLQIEITGPSNSVEQYINHLHKTSSEAERFGIELTVERVNSEELQDDAFE